MTSSETKQGRDSATRGESPEDLTDHEYFRSLEDLFIGLRGAPLLLSPSDWKTAASWRRAGIPLDVIARVLREMFERRADRKGLGGVRSLKYFDSAVQRAWEQILELGGDVDGPARAEALDITARLRSLAGSLPVHLDWVEEIRGELLTLKGSAQEVERSLAALDSKLVRLASRSVESAIRSSIDDQVDEVVERLAGRIEASRMEETRDQLSRRILRRTLGLPVLSLFSPEAIPRPADAAPEDEP